MKNIKNIKRLFLTLAFCISLSGCFYQTVNSYDIMRASSLCKGTENIVEISADFAGNEVCTCKNGQNYSLSEYKGKD